MLGESSCILKTGNIIILSYILYNIMIQVEWNVLRSGGYENITCRPCWENLPESLSCSTHNTMIVMCNIILQWRISKCVLWSAWVIIFTIHSNLLASRYADNYDKNKKNKRTDINNMILLSLNFIIWLCK